MQLEVTAFNSSQKYVVFTARTCLTGCTTVATFAAINFFHTNRLLALCNGMIAIQNFLVFRVLYDKGFSIPRNMVKLKKVLHWKLRSSRLIGFEEKKHLGREIKSVGTVAVLVGRFHFLQRTSTPTFADTCAKYSVRLLMIMKRFGT